MDRIQGLKLPRIISDGMIIQRNEEIKIWGHESAGVFIDVYFAGCTYTAVGDKEGNWKVVMPAMEAGGPYELIITVGNKKRMVIQDILIGDLWLCGGQSNMELPISRVMERYKEEVETYENNKIRMFQVPMTYDFNGPLENIRAGIWQRLNQSNAKNFTAVGYFFAKALYEKYQVPIGLIHTAIGGTPIEAWMSEEALKQFPAYIEQSAKYKDKAFIQKTLVDDITRINAWYNRLDEVDLSLKERELIKGRWYDAREMEGWKDCELPSFLVDENLVEAGSVWYRKVVQVPENMAGKAGRILLGTIVDNDHVILMVVK
ncbi:sialate O-acetylesterase [Cellulosilyticum ruminicola]|uniref:sialate O-acetylesterase n=1 Tax=Cellulosilyticum ruminicola TaxID=425254 RepID=UPI0006CF7FCA|nr:sialate O-acetylesterase [Cellulosilyticum ruminicola]